MSDVSFRRNNLRNRLRSGLAILVLGLALLTLGTDPGLFGLDFSPVIGFVQIGVLLVGLAMICLGGYACINMLWEGQEKSITADIGFRLVATGYVFAAAAGMADVIGFGSQPLPNIPYFGPWQAIGVIVGEIIIILGFILMTPRPPRKTAQVGPEQPADENL